MANINRDHKLTERNEQVRLSKDNLRRYSQNDWKRTPEVEDGKHFIEAFQIIKNVPPGDFLDVGCATSPLGRRLISLGWKCHGLEIAETAAIAKQAGIKVHSCDLADNWPVPEKFFDVVFAGEVIEHFLDTYSFVENVYACLKPGGMAIFSTPNLVSFENRLRALFGFHPRFMDFFLGPTSIGHCRYFTPQKFRTLLDRSSFCNIVVKSINPVLLTKKREWRLPIFFNKLGLGTTLFATAQKTGQ